jgi:hypothetical protein
MPTKMPAYYVMSTLLAGGDTNRRTIYRGSDNEPVCVFNQRMRDWTVGDERLLNICLSALLADAENQKDD